MTEDDPLFGGGDDPMGDLGPRRRRAGGTAAEAPPAPENLPAPSPAPTPAFDAEGYGPNLGDLESVPPEGLPALELESIPPAPRRIPAADLAMAEDVPAVAPAPTGGGDTAPRDGDADIEGRATKPAGFEVLPPDSAEPLPTLEVAAAAGYGPAPGFVGAIPYVIHVYSRRKELVVAAEDARRHRKTAEQAVETALAHLGRRVVEKAADLGGAVEALTDDLEGARAAVTLVGAAQDAAARDDADRERRKHEMRAELETLERELAPHQDHENKLLTQLKVREQDLARARAKHQRAEIELRNAQNDPASTPDRLALAEAGRDRQLQETAVAEQPVKELSAQLAEIKRALAEKLGRKAQLEHDLANIDQQRDATKRAQFDSEATATKNARGALATLARRALAAGVAASADAEATKRVAVADDELSRRRRRERIVAAAIDSYDKPTFYQGLGVLGAAALVIAIFVLFVLFRAIF